MLVIHWHWISVPRTQPPGLWILLHRPASIWSRWTGEALKWGGAAIASYRVLSPIVWMLVANWHVITFCKRALWKTRICWVPQARKFWLIQVVSKGGIFPFWYCVSSESNNAGFCCTVCFSNLQFYIFWGAHSWWVLSFSLLFVIVHDNLFSLQLSVFPFCILFALLVFLYHCQILFERFYQIYDFFWQLKIPDVAPFRSCDQHFISYMLE